MAVHVTAGGRMSALLDASGCPALVKQSQIQVIVDLPEQCQSMLQASDFGTVETAFVTSSQGGEGALQEVAGVAETAQQFDTGLWRGVRLPDG